MSNQIYRGKFDTSAISFGQRVNRIVGHGHLSIWLTTVFVADAKQAALDDCLSNKAYSPLKRTVPVALRYDKVSAPMVTPKQSLRLINNDQSNLSIQTI